MFHLFLELIIIPDIEAQNLVAQTATLMCVVLNLLQLPGWPGPPRSQWGPLGPPPCLDGNQRMNLQTIDSITYLSRLAVTGKGCHLHWIQGKPQRIATEKNA
jgi:hypothetical protein